MGSLNLNSIRNKIKDTKKLKETIDKSVKTKFQKAKEEYIESFLNHPVTKEIASGPEAANSSNTLSGRGNLFSFIGFNNGSNPIGQLESNIKESFSLDKQSTSVNQSKIKVKYKVSYPSQTDLEKNTPMPWEGGNSWVTAIERGISGFSNYMYKKFNSSRSGTGIQVKNKVTSGSYKPTKYFSEIINRFLNSVNKIK
jgi:hypothetical protein